MNAMLWPTIIMGVIALVMLYLGYMKGEAQHIDGLKSGGILTLQIIPLLFFAMIIAAMVPVLIPTELVASFAGQGSGMKGVLLGALGGTLSLGPPFVSMSILLGLLRAGAGPGFSVSFIAAWSLCSLGRIPVEVSILGWKFTLIRWLCTFLLPVIAGWLAMMLFSRAKLI